MKILYAFQGTGNGHAARARALIPELAKHATVDIATSGMNSELDVGAPILLRYSGVTYHSNGRGAISPWRTLKNLHLRRAFKDFYLAPVEHYDLVVNDFEPITAYAAKRAGVPAVGVSHQAAFLSCETPRPPRKDYFAEAIFRHYAPTKYRIGFHFERYDSFILPPILRHEVRHEPRSNLGHLTVYLPGFDDLYLVPLLQQLAPKKVHLFSRAARMPFTSENVSVEAISNDSFIRSLLSCDAFLAGAGFEGPAEALHLGKKLLVVPLGGQYEQRCNAAALARFGVPVLSTINASNVEFLREWAFVGKPVEMCFPDVLPEVIERIIQFGH